MWKKDKFDLLQYFKFVQRLIFNMMYIISIPRYCGTRLPPQTTTFTNVMTIIFEADSSISHEGFSASYRMFDSNEGKDQ